jgi:hypothetical protein
VWPGRRLGAAWPETGYRLSPVVARREQGLAGTRSATGATSKGPGSSFANHGFLQPAHQAVRLLAPGGPRAFAHSLRIGRRPTAPLGASAARDLLLLQPPHLLPQLRVFVLLARFEYDRLANDQRLPYRGLCVPARFLSARMPPTAAEEAAPLKAQRRSANAPNVKGSDKPHAPAGT